jgi:hypothetical protein
MESEKKAATPPYVPYKTFKNFLERFKQGTPSRIDRDLMGTMSGALQSQLTTALRYLGFTSENNLPLEPMKAFVVAEGDQRKSLLKAALLKSYPYLFGDNFDISSATASHLREAIEANTSASGETVDRCIAFLKDAAQDAGIVVSKYITQKKPRGSAPKKRNGAQRKSAESDHAKTPFPPGSGSQQHPPTLIMEAQNSMLLWGLFQRLPKPGSVWPKQQRDQWTETLNNVLALEYKEQ